MSEWLNSADFIEPLSEMLGRRAKAIQGQLDSFPSYRRSHQPSVQAAVPAMDGQCCNDILDESIATPVLPNNQGVIYMFMFMFTYLVYSAVVVDEYVIQRVVHAGVQDFRLTSPRQHPAVPGSPGLTCLPEIKLLGPVLDQDNPLFNCSPEAVGGSSSDAPTSFAPNGSDTVELPSSASVSSEDPVTYDQNILSTPVRSAARVAPGQGAHLSF